MSFDLPEDAERSRRWLRGAVLRVAQQVYEDVTPVVESDDGRTLVAAVPDDEPGRYVCTVRVASAPAHAPVDAAEPIRRAGQALADDGWAVGDLHAEAERYEVVAHRAGATIVAAISTGEGILRLSGRSPVFVLAPVTAPAPPAGPLESDRGWEPNNDVEAALWRASLHGDPASFFELLQTAPLFIPRLGADGFATLTVDDRVHLAVFSSPETLRYVTGEAESVPVTFGRLAVQWPDDDWDLAVNPGTPIEAYLALPDVPAAAEGRLTVPGFPVAPDRSGAAHPLVDNEVEQRLADALAADDRDAVLDALADADQVWVDWQVRPVAGTPSICVYTSPRRAGADSVATSLAEVAGRWPDRSYQLVVNPGSDLMVTLPGFAVWALGEQLGESR